jgi:hypothetical protein
MSVPEDLREVLPDSAPLVGKAGDGHLLTTDTQGPGSRVVEDVEVRVAGETRMGDPGSFVVSRNDKNGNTPVCDLKERFECLVDESRCHPRPMEQVSSVNHQVNRTGNARGQSPLMICQEIEASPPPCHSGPGRKIEAQMGIGQQEYPNGWRRMGHGVQGR